MLEFVIQGQLLSLNEYILKCRANKYAANSAKHKMHDIVWQGYLESHQGELGKPPYQLNITYYEPNSRKDVDNVIFAVKFILDSLVKNGVLENDNQKFIKKISSSVLLDKEKPHINVIIEEYKNDN